MLLFLQAGFRFHHAEPDYLMLVNWIPNTPDTLPANASHRVGVGAFVINNNKEVVFSLFLFSIWSPSFAACKIQGGNLWNDLASFDRCLWFRRQVANSEVQVYGRCQQELLMKYIKIITSFFFFWQKVCQNYYWPNYWTSKIIFWYVLNPFAGWGSLWSCN